MLAGLANVLLVQQAAFQLTSGTPNFPCSYGYMSASYAITAWVLLLVGIVMWAGSDTSFWSQTVKWNGKWGSLYTATYVLAWVSSGTATVQLQQGCCQRSSQLCLLSCAFSYHSRMHVPTCELLPC